MRYNLVLLAVAGVLLPAGPLAAQPAEPVPPAVDVPQWAQEAVWYQIFPERFRNGDRSNDPTVDDIRGSWPHAQPEGWQISDWTADWYDRAAWERAASDDFYFSVQLRRYGGDLQGVIDRLGYLDSLGITALYFNPVFESPSLHKYDGASYHHVDDNFGPDPEADRRLVAQETPTDPGTWHWTSADRLLLELIDEAHGRGMRVILDGVFNHMGLRSFAFEDVQRRQQASHYHDWFTVTAWDDPATPDTSEFAYEGWMGVAELPQLREDEDGLVEPVRDYVFASVRRWMDPDGDGDPSDGVDGWRLDVAEMVDLRFWHDFRDTVRSIDPEAYLVGEVWWEDWSNHTMFDASPWLDGAAFDAVMNYRWARATRRFFLGSDLEAGQTYSPTDFASELRGLYEDYPPAVNFALMNVLGSHDTDRLASQVVNPDTRFDHAIGVKENPAYRVRQPNADERQLQRLMLAHQFTYVGAPHLFYGDEAGMWGADDPDERKPMVWPDMEYDPETHHPLGHERPRDEVVFDHDLFEYYRTLAHLRNAHPALQRGSFEVLLADDGARTFGYERRYGEDVVWVVFNAGTEAQQVTLPVEAERPAAGHTPVRSLSGTTVRDVVTGATATLSGRGLSARMPAHSVRIWRLASAAPLTP